LAFNAAHHWYKYYLSWCVNLGGKNIEQATNTLQVNKFARRSRHLRNFSRSLLLKTHFFEGIKTFGKSIANVNKVPFIAVPVSVVGRLYTKVREILPVSPQRRVIFKASLCASFIILGTAFVQAPALIDSSLDYSDEYISSYALPGDVLVADSDGYLVKINPQTDKSNRVGLTDFAVHTVEEGEVLSLISEKYGVSMDTIIWENNLRSANSLKIGQKLLIPPVNGISYKVKSGDTLEKVAKKYNVKVESIVAQNGFADASIAIKGKTIFLPGAKPIAPPVIADSSRTGTASRSVSVRNVDYSNIPNSSSAPSVGKIFIYPTKGSITQKYFKGHYAIDIADRSKPPIWAAGNGTVVKVSTNTWGGGYGNHVIIDHGNGLKSLYAHMDSVNVTVGQYVTQGDVIGIMGNTGRVYGVTGIHLHWEVIQNGVKQNPMNYY